MYSAPGREAPLPLPSDACASERAVRHTVPISSLATRKLALQKGVCSVKTEASPRCGMREVHETGITLTSCCRSSARKMRMLLWPSTMKRGSQLIEPLAFLTTFDLCSADGGE